jgi:hypothetical protein
MRVLFDFPIHLQAFDGRTKKLPFAQRAWREAASKVILTLFIVKLENYLCCQWCHSSFSQVRRADEKKPPQPLFASEVL